MENSHISWCNHTFNGWIGCTKVSPGCKLCYAWVRDRRFAGGVHWGKGALRQRTTAANWRQPVLWNRRADLSRVIDDAVWLSQGTSETLGQPASRVVIAKCVEGNGNCVWEGMFRDIPILEWGCAPQQRPRVFCASLSDWLDEEVPIEWVADLLALIHATPNLDWLLLTKRPENWRARIEQAEQHMLGGDFDSCVRGGEFDSWLMATGWMTGDAPANVWIGTTVEDQARADERIPALLNIPARVRFLSCEPLLEKVRLVHIGPINTAAKIHTIDWVICGGESGAGARAMEEGWARSLREQCRAAGVAFFMKQLGGRGDARGALEQLPADLRVREFPAAAAEVAR